MKLSRRSVIFPLAIVLTGLLTILAFRLEAAWNPAPNEDMIYARTQRDHYRDESTPLRPFQVVNAHEHFLSSAQLVKYFQAAEKAGIVRTIALASSDYTLMGPDNDPASGVDENTQEIRNAARTYPDRLIPFCTIAPSDPGKLDKLKAYVADGTKGLKLYTGHSNFYKQPLDTPDMMPIYAYCNEVRLPICWHINLTRYLPEFERVMQQYPDLIVIVPHFGVTFFHPRELPFQQFERLMDTYSNLYTDTSFGTREILVKGLEAVSHEPEVFRSFFARHSDRILFGTDMVITGNREKTAEWIESVIRACRDMLEKDSFHFFLGAQGSPYASKEENNIYGAYCGLALDDVTLKKVYETNIERLFPTPTP